MKEFKYKVFDNININAIGNPSIVFLLEENDILSTEDKSCLAMKAKFPISCFVEINNDVANIEFFAPNGSKENICFHGTMSVLKMIHDLCCKKIKKINIKNFNNIKMIDFGNDIFGIQYHNDNLISKMINNKQIFMQNLLLAINNLKEKHILDIFDNQKTNDYIIELSDVTILENLEFDMQCLKQIIIDNKKRAFMFFAKKNESTIESRIFYINLDTLEDVCCGSANLSFSKILLEKYNISKYNNIQPFNIKNQLGGYQEVIVQENEMILSGHVTVM